MPATAGFGLLAEQHLHVLQPVIHQPAARCLGADPALAARRVGQVHQSILGKAWMQGHVEQSALALHGDRWQALHRPRVQRAVGSDQAQPPRPLGHQPAPVGQERQPPRVFEPPGYSDHAKVVLLAGDDRIGGSGEVADEHGNSQNGRGEQAC